MQNIDKFFIRQRYILCRYLYKIIGNFLGKFVYFGNVLFYAVNFIVVPGHKRFHSRVETLHCDARHICRLFYQLTYRKRGRKKKSFIHKAFALDILLFLFAVGYDYFGELYKIFDEGQINCSADYVESRMEERYAGGGFTEPLHKHVFIESAESPDKGQEYERAYHIEEQMIKARALCICVCAHGRNYRSDAGTYICAHYDKEYAVAASAYNESRLRHYYEHGSNRAGRLHHRRYAHTDKKEQYGIGYGLKSVFD